MKRRRFFLKKDSFDARVNTVFVQLGEADEYMYEYETTNSIEFGKVHRQYVEDNDEWFEEIIEEPPSIDILLFARNRCIKFADWVFKENWVKKTSTSRWNNYINGNLISRTTDELYKEFSKIKDIDNEE